jgi:SAM-dependent methyltransferase
MPDWNELFRDDRNVLEVPDPLALELASTLAPRSRVLDLGCGAGRHLGLLADMGHHPVGVDSAPEGLTRSRRRLEEAGFRAVLARADFRRPLPFPDAAFDAILTVKSINHAMPEEAALAFAEAIRVLRPGGRLVGSVIAASDVRCGDGVEIAERTFVHDRPPEEGVPHHYFTEAELRQRLAGCSFVTLFLTERLVGPDDPIFGRYRVREGAPPIFRHWCFRAIR